MHRPSAIARVFSVALPPDVPTLPWEDGAPVDAISDSGEELTLILHAPDRLDDSAEIILEPDDSADALYLEALADSADRLFDAPGIVRPDALPTFDDWAPTLEAHHAESSGGIFAHWCRRCDELFPVSPTDCDDWAPTLEALRH